MKGWRGIAACAVLVGTPIAAARQCESEPTNHYSEPVVAFAHQEGVPLEDAYMPPEGSAQPQEQGFDMMAYAGALSFVAACIIISLETDSRMRQADA